MWKSPRFSVLSSHSRALGLTPRSMSAPTIMSPLIPVTQSRYRTFIGWCRLAARRRPANCDQFGERDVPVVKSLADDATVKTLHSRQALDVVGAADPSASDEIAAQRDEHFFRLGEVWPDEHAV